MIRALVFGDAMLDVRVAGACLRESPEAPGVPVMSNSETTYSPGGAANVALNLAALGAAPTLMAAIGRDHEGGILQHLLALGRIGMALMGRDEARTTAKIRFIGDGRHLLRLDVESRVPLSEAHERLFIDQFAVEAPLAEAVVISDYDKGVVTGMTAARLIAIARERDIPVVVDAKQPELACFAGATVLKPNLREIARALGKPQPETIEEAIKDATRLWQACEAQYVLLTCGEMGMCLIGAEGAMAIPAHPIEAVDVTGAGDAVAAGLALALAMGVGIVEAARFANAAGAVVVTKRGTASPTPEEVAFFYEHVGENCRPAHRTVESQGTQGRLH